MEERTKEMQEKVKEEAEQVINDILDEGIRMDNVDYLGKIVDIHKDICNEKYWKEKEEHYMRYRGYGNEYGRRDYRGEEYGRGRSRDSRGRYEARGYDTKYRGHDMIDEMDEHYGNYSEAREEVNRGNYGAKDDSMKSLEYMMDCVVCFVEMLQEEATPEEMQIIKKYSRKISEM